MSSRTDLRAFVFVLVAVFSGCASYDGGQQPVSQGLAAVVSDAGLGTDGGGGTSACVASQRLALRAHTGRTDGIYKVLHAVAGLDRDSLGYCSLEPLTPGVE